MRYLTKLYRGLSFLSILKTLFVLTWLIILAGFGPVSSDGQRYRYPVSFLNDRARDITGAAAVNAPGFVAPGGLTGEGQIVAVADSGLDAGSMDDIHPDLKSEPGKMPKVVLLKSWAGREAPDDPDGHGTHMAAAIAGTGAASNGKFRGIAPGASIYFQAILDSEGNPAPPANLADLFFPAYSAGARVHVNGWGGGKDTYLQPASQVDDFVRGHPDFLAIFGAGNSGPSASTITGEANSKNALVVGSSILPRPAFVPGVGDTTAPAEFSSRGPAGDGRIKPELLAPASAVISARSSLVEGNLPGYQDYTRLQGTSMAAAVAGGSSALVREYFKKYMDMATPSAALVKAALVNGARPAAGGPSLDGFGTIDLAGTIIALKESSFSLADEWAGVPQGGEITYTYHVSGGAAPFKATLAWTDPPAEPGSAKTLVNDLDLKVKTPDGRIYYGNHFLGANAPDRKNNVEQVYLPSPAPGVYTVTVSGTAVRRNTVRGANSLLQDFALVWGQPPAEGCVEQADGGTVQLAGGSSFNITDSSVVNLVDDEIAPSDAVHILPGAAVFQTSKQVYLTARLWRETGVKALKTQEGTVLSEMNPAARLGGYRLAPGTLEITLNKSPILPERIPPGVEISAVINPRDQKLRQVQAVYTESTGVISDIREEKGHKVLYLAGGGSYRISPRAAYSYEDIYANADKKDTPFGTGALEQLEDVLPGLPVLLRLAPSSGEVQYLAVKRRVALGAVREVNASSGEIWLENGTCCRMLPGAPVRKDRSISDLESIKPGDHVTAVLLPDTGEAIGVVAYSSVVYGKAVVFAENNRTLYLLDDTGRYRSLYLPYEAVIYRWGVKSTTDAVASGSRIRVTTDLAGETVWQLDIAETLCEQAVLENYDEIRGIVVTKDEKQYQVSDTTRFFKNGQPLLPGDIQPGENVEVEYTVAPPPTGNVLLSMSAAGSAAPPPLLFSVVPLQSGMLVTGSTGINTQVYIWQGTSCQAVPVGEDGRFKTIFIPEESDYSFTLVALDRRAGGVAGRLTTPAAEARAGGGYDAAVLKKIFSAWSGLPGRTNSNSASGTPLTRVEMAEVLARLLSWPKVSEKALVFTDASDIPYSFRPAVAEACARGVLNGYTDGSFKPLASINRAETAVLLSTVLRDLGINIETDLTPPYPDAGEIPAWAADAVNRATAAGLFDGRPDGRFAPGEPVTLGETALLLERLLIFCEHRLGE